MKSSNGSAPRSSYGGLPSVILSELIPHGDHPIPPKIGNFITRNCPLTILHSTIVKLYEPNDELFDEDMCEDLIQDSADLLEEAESRRNLYYPSGLSLQSIF
jgi:hypothetical protein